MPEDLKKSDTKEESIKVEAHDQSVAVGKIEVGGNVEGGIHIGNTIIQKFFNIFKSDAETLEQRNRRILLGHVENAWIKGVLDASLYGAAMLDLGIKETPEAITNKYPWAIKKESTKETLPAGTSMLEIFDSIGMGRSLLILGAPGSGKTTMLLELARGLIARAREDVTQPIPMVFNLASWTEKLSLADWLAQELNNLYSVPRKTAPDWVKGNKLLLLLDGLDEVRQESRAKCVEAINEFRKEHGLTSLAVCSRSQDYADLNAKLSFEGAIEFQPLTQKQITEFFNRFGKEMVGIKQALKKDNALREMAETPLFLSIMLMTYRDKLDKDILVSGDEKARRKYLFDNYIERMFERRLENIIFKKQDMLHWLSWLASKMIEHNDIPYFSKDIHPSWLHGSQHRRYDLNVSKAALFFGLCVGMFSGLSIGLIFDPNLGAISGLVSWWVTWGVNNYGGFFRLRLSNQKFTLIRRSLKTKSARRSMLAGISLGINIAIFIGLSIGIFGGIIGGMQDGLIGILSGVYIGLKVGLFVLVGGLIAGLFSALNDLNERVVQYYALIFTLIRNNLLPWRLVPFLDHCVDLIFLRRVGGGYIFIHRLLMEHFAELYVESPTSKGN